MRCLLLDDDDAPKLSKTVIEIVVNEENGDITALVGRSKRPNRAISRGEPGSAVQRVPLTPQQSGRSDGGHPAPRRGPTLVTPDRLVVRCVLDLPSAAESSLDQLLRYELPARMPFAESDAYYRYRIAKRRRDRVLIEVFGAERRRLDQLRAMLAAVGLDPASAIVANGGLDLLAAERQPSAIAKALAVAIVVLSCIVAALGYATIRTPVERQREVIAHLHQDIDSLRAAAARADRLSDAIATLVQDRNALINRLDGWPARIVIVNEVARVLPDDAWLTSLEIDGDVLRIAGMATSATPLVAAVAASPIFTEPQFPSSIHRDARENVERFELHARIATEAP